MAVHSSNTDDLINYAKQNVAQLLLIGVHDIAAHIENHFGGEIGLVAVTNDYLSLVERLVDLKSKEESEEN